MISAVVPTWNRAYTLQQTLSSVFTQESVSEVVLVSDASTDDTQEVFAEISARYPHVVAKFVQQPERKGQAAARNEGARHVDNEYILYCDDDEYLEPHYAETCLDILQSRGAGAVSGRRVYMFAGETQKEALARFGNGFRRRAPFDKWTLELVNAAKFDGDVVLPFTNSIILTRTKDVRAIGFDEFYGAYGSGYREESDYQLSLSLSGRDVVMTNRVHSIHLPMTTVKTGGARSSAWSRMQAMVRNNNHFYDRHYDGFRRKFGAPLPKWLAKALYAAFACHRVFLHPTLYDLGVKIVYATHNAPIEIEQTSLRL